MEVAGLFGHEPVRYCISHQLRILLDLSRASSDGNMTMNFRHLPDHVDLSLILRGLFASAVVYWHTLGYQNTSSAVSLINIPGRLSVWMFFGLSGYVIGYGFFSLKHRTDWAGLAKYWRRRFMRIVPLFLLITALYYAIMSTRGLAPEKIIEDFPQAVLMLQYQHHNYPIGVFWTLGVELHFYVIAPLIAYLWLAAGRYGVLAGIASYLAIWAVFGDTIDDRSMPGNLHHFLLGMLVAKLYLAGKLDRIVAKGWTAWAFGSAGIVFVMICNRMYFDNNFWSYAGSLVAGMALFCLLITHCAIERRSVRLGPVTSLLMWVGVLAYGIYAWHGGLLVLWPSLVDSFVVLYLLSTGLALLSFQFVEAPLQEMARGGKVRLGHSSGSQP